MVSKELNIEKLSSAEERDGQIGRGLTKQMGAGAASKCPPMEDIAALIDGSIEGEARNQLLKHLAACEKCFEVFTTTRELLEVEEAPAKKSSATLVFSAIAVAAVLVVAVTISFQGNKQVQTNVAVVKENTAPLVQTKAALPTLAKEVPLPAVPEAVDSVTMTASASAAMLAQAGNVGLLVESIPPGSPTLYGFSGATASDKAAFRLGSHATDLELLLWGNDRNAVMSRLNLVVELLRQGGDRHPEVERLVEIMRRVEAGEVLQNFVGCTSSLAKGLSRDSDRFLYRFGIIAEGGRLAAIAGIREYVTIASLRYVRYGVERMQLPDGVANAIGEIEVIVKRGEYSEKDFLGMKRGFEDIVAMF